MYLMNITKNEPNRARADLVTKKLRQFLYQNKLQALIIFFFLLISVFQRVVFCLLFLSTAKQRKVNNVKNAYINTVKCSGTLITYTIITILETSYYRTKQCVLIQYLKKTNKKKRYSQWCTSLPYYIVRQHGRTLVTTVHFRRRGAVGNVKTKVLGYSFIALES